MKLDMRNSSRRRFIATPLPLLVIGLLALPIGCRKKQARYPDFSTPQAAAVTFARAMENGDAQVAREASMAGGMEVDLVDSMTNATFALKSLARASERKFGAQAKDVLRGTGAMDASESLAHGEVAFDGDERASVTPKDGKTVIPLQLIDNNWKVDIGALIKGEDVIGSMPLLESVRDAAREMTPLVEAGKYKSIDEMKTDLQSRIMRNATTRGVTPASAPADLPALTVPAAPQETTPPPTPPSQ